MTATSERIDELRTRAQAQRETLADAALDLRVEFDRRRQELRVAGLVIGGLVAAGTAAFKLFGKNSLAARVGRVSSGASLVIGLARAAMRLSRFF